MNIEVHMIPTQIVPHMWTIFGPMIQKAADLCADEFDIEDTYKAVIEERAGLFGVFVNKHPKAGLIASPVQYPKQRVLLLEMIGGTDLEQWWEDALYAIVEKARSAGYDAIEARGRRGWSKMAKQMNFKEAYTVYKLGIENV